MRPDKQKIIDEVWDEERVRSFLGKSTPTQFGEDLPGDPDFYLLLNAYRAMRVDDFKRFLNHYLSEGHQLDAKNENGLTLAEYLVPYKKSAPFISLLKQTSP